MQVDNFIKYIEQSTPSSSIPENELAILLKEFPYCQTGQLLSAVQLKLTNSILFDQQLKKAAAYCTDRNQLFNLLNNKQTKAPVNKEPKKEVVTKTEVAEVIVKDELPQPKEIKTKEKPKKELDTLEKEYLSSAISSTIFLESSPTPNTEEKTPVIETETTSFDEHEGHSFSNWIKHYNGENVVEKKSSPEPNNKVKQDLIDRFIQEDPKIQPKKTAFYSPTNMARLSVVDESDIVSETLALIYVDQGDYKRAIDAYKKLILKNPEKRSYFVSQITILNQKLK